MKDVAALAGLSPTTVSLVLNSEDTPNIPDATRARVRAAAKQLGYRIDAAGRALRSRTTRTLGLVTDQIASGPYAGEVITGAQESAWRAGHVLVVVNTGERKEVERAAWEVMFERNVDGVIVASYYTREVFLPSEADHLPTVLVNCFESTARRTTLIPDELGCGRTATEFLLARGHRSIANITGLLSTHAGRKRLEGYQAALAEAGVRARDDLVVEGNWWPDSGYRAFRQLFSLRRPPTAVICGNDRTAVGVYMAAKEAGVRIPDDLAVIGCDDQDYASHLEPSLASLQIPFFEMGRLAAQRLIEGASADDSAEVTELPLATCIRASLGPKRANRKARS
jgi:LacI family transcriptional regulator